MIEHDSLCPAQKSKAKCVCDIIEKARLQGFEAGISESSWLCGDCGNTYDYTVVECPNKILDEIGAAKR